MPLFFVDKFCDCLTGLPRGGSSRRHGADDWRQSSQKAPTIGRKSGKNCGSNNPFSISSESDFHSLLHFGCLGS